MTFTLVSARRSGVCATAIALLLPAAAHACACGCGVFDVGDNAVVPMASDNGVTLFYRFSAMSQNDNREHGHAADHSHTSGGDAIPQRQLLENPEFHQLRQGRGHGDVRSGNGGRAGAHISL